MDRYMIESPHKAEDCEKILELFAAAGYLHNFDWGCADGVHCGWAIVETDNPAHAAQIVPWTVRDVARVIKLVKYEAADHYHDIPLSE
jgi:hypothetical protein